MDEGIVPPSKTLVKQVRRNRIAALTRHSTVDKTDGDHWHQNRRTEKGRMTSGDRIADSAAFMT